MGRCNVLDVACSNPLPLPIVIGMIVRRRLIQMSTKKGKAKPRQHQTAYFGMPVEVRIRGKVLPNLLEKKQ